MDISLKIYKWPTSSVINEMPSKPHLAATSTYTRMVIIYNTVATRVGKDVEKLELSYIASGI